MLLVGGLHAAAQTPSNVSALKKLSLDELLDIDVTSVSRRAEKLSETASAIQVITAEDINRAGASSLPQALRLASNLGVAQVDSRQWAISARGFNSTTANKLLVLIDGRTIYTPLYSGVFWDVQDVMLEDLDRIEVISGPGVTLWGANAVNGVVNITTKNARDTQGLLLLGGGGTELRGFGGVRYGGAVGTRLHYRVYGKYSDRDSTVTTEAGRDAANDWHTGQGGLRLDWAPSGNDSLTLQGDAYGGGIAQPAGAIAVRGKNTLGRWTRTFAADSELQVQFYYDHTYRNIPNTLTEGLDTYDFDAQQRIPIGRRHNLVCGIGYRVIRDRVTNTPALAFLPATVSRDWFNAFAQDEIALADGRLRLTLGTKIEHNDYTGFELQPSARLNWRVSDRQTVWGAISRAVRTPSRIDREFFVPGAPPYVIAGGPNFVSEEVLAYETGLRTEPFDNVRLAVATFYNDYDRIRSVERVNPAMPAPTVIGNGQEGESYGAELTADYHVTDSWRLHAGYTELRIHLRPKPGSSDRSFGSVESRDPKRQAFLRSSLDFAGNFQLDANFRHVGRIGNQNVPAYEELDVRLAWRPSTSVELSVIGQNLLRDRHSEFGAPATRQEIQRGVYGKMLWRF